LVPTLTARMGRLPAEARTSPAGAISVAVRRRSQLLGAGDEVEGGQRDDSVSEATEAVDEDALHGGFHGGSSLRADGAESNPLFVGFSVRIGADGAVFPSYRRWRRSAVIGGRISASARVLIQF
jgi:hypothetical protein